MDEVVVNSLTDFINWAKCCHKVYVQDLDAYYFREDECLDNHVFFRGHASFIWNLSPSLFRDSSVRFDEHDMLRQACNLSWSELNNCKTDLEKLVVLQHFGLKTRLLDVSYNPLVALYFACDNEKNKNEDGVVFSGVMKETPLNVCNAIADYVFNHSSESEIDELFLSGICEKYDVEHLQLADCCFF